MNCTKCWGAFSSSLSFFCLLPSAHPLFPITYCTSEASLSTRKSEPEPANLSPLFSFSPHFPGGAECSALLGPPVREAQVSSGPGGADAVSEELGLPCPPAQRSWGGTAARGPWESVRINVPRS